MLRFLLFISFVYTISCIKCYSAHWDHTMKEMDNKKETECGTACKYCVTATTIEKGNETLMEWGCGCDGEPQPMCTGSGTKAPGKGYELQCCEGDLCNNQEPPNHSAIPNIIYPIFFTLISVFFVYA